MLVIVGKTGSGKTTLVDELIRNYGFEKVVTCTTRPMRQGEVEGKDYHFLTQEEFNKKEKNGEFAETASYNASFGYCSYGSYKSDYENIDDKKVIILNPYGLKAIKDKDIPHTSVYISVPEETIRQRLQIRGDSQEEITRRLRTDERDFANIKTDITLASGDMSVHDIAESLISVLDMQKEFEDFEKEVGSDELER